MLHRADAASRWQQGCHGPCVKTHWGKGCGRFPANCNSYIAVRDVCLHDCKFSGTLPYNKCTGDRCFAMLTVHRFWRTQCVRRFHMFGALSCTEQYGEVASVSPFFLLVCCVSRQKKYGGLRWLVYTGRIAHVSLSSVPVCLKFGTFLQASKTAGPADDHCLPIQVKEITPTHPACPLAAW